MVNFISIYILHDSCSYEFKTASSDRFHIYLYKVIYLFKLFHCYCRLIHSSVPKIYDIQDFRFFLFYLFKTAWRSLNVKSWICRLFLSRSCWLIFFTIWIFTNKSIYTCQNIFCVSKLWTRHISRCKLYNLFNYIIDKILYVLWI